MVQVVEEVAGGKGVVMPPEFHDVAIGVDVGQMIERVGQGEPLCCDQGSGVSFRSFGETEFDEELDAKFPDMRHRLEEPVFESISALIGAPMKRAVGSGVTGFSVVGFGQVGANETIEGAIDKGSVDGENTAEVGFPSKLPSDGKAVGGAFPHQGENHPLGQRQVN